MLKIGETLGNSFFQIFCTFTVSKDRWKISCRMGANSLCNVCRIMCLNVSGPVALCRFKLNCFKSYAYVRHFGWGLGWNGRLTPESWRSCNDFSAKKFKLMGL